MGLCPLHLVMVQTPVHWRRMEDEGCPCLGQASLHRGTACRTQFPRRRAGALTSGLLFGVRIVKGRGGTVTADLPPSAYLIGLAYRSCSASNCDKRKVFITSRQSPRASAVSSDWPVSPDCGIKGSFVFIYLHGSFPEKTARLVTCALCIMLIRFENSYIVFIRAITFSLIKLREK